MPPALQLPILQALRTSTPQSSLSVCLQCYSTRLRSLTVARNNVTSHKPLGTRNSSKWSIFFSRSFSTTQPSFKSNRGGKKDSKRTVELNEEKTEEIEDPLDLTKYENEIKEIQQQSREDLSKIRPGGVSVEQVEETRVHLGKGTGRKDAVNVGDLSQVIARGREVVILVGEKEHTHSIVSALLSTHSLSTLPPSSHAPLELHVPIPPTTSESRQRAQKVASARGQEALHQLREARGAQHKTFRALKLAQKVGPDQRRRAEKQMEKMNENANAEVKRMVEEKRRALGEGWEERG
ncbi:MAG: hypothetical protein Q9167_004303 [Letrouitia subvulpina]